MSCTLGESCKLLYIVDGFLIPKPPAGVVRYSLPGLANHASPAHFLRYFVTSVSLVRLIQKSGRGNRESEYGI